MRLPRIAAAMVFAASITPALAQTAPPYTPPTAAQLDMQIATAEKNANAQVAAARTQYENMLNSLGGLIDVQKQRIAQLTDEAKKREQGWAEYSKPLWAVPGK